VFGTNRAFETGCLESQPVGEVHTYYGTRVFDGALRYNGTLVTPSWGGSMFEALMPALFVPEERWAPRSWGVNHPLVVDAQIHHGLAEAGYGYWGFSPANIPEGGYDAYGVDGIGSNPDGYYSNEDHTGVDPGFPGCREPKPDPPPSDYTNGVVTPHAAALALRYRPHAAVADLRKLERDFAVYTPLGFRDSVNVDSGAVSRSYLSLDQGMIMAALGNALGHDVLRRAFATRDVERALRPVIGVEEFAHARSR
jgi:putative glucoamylase